MTLLLGIAAGASAQERVPQRDRTFTLQEQQAQPETQGQPARPDDTSLVVGMGIVVTGVAGAALAVGRCDVLLVIIGQHWCDTMAGGKRRLDDPHDHPRIEVESALQRDIPVIPVLVQGASLPEEGDLPEGLRPLVYRNAQPVRSDPNFAGDIERLVHGVEVQFGTAHASAPH